MSSNGLKLEKITYNRAYQAARTSSICLVGSSRWLRDLELLMEDEWKNLSIALSQLELGEQIAKNAPALFIVECGAYGSGEQHIIESLLPKGSKKLVVSNGSIDPLTWARTKKYCVSQSISTIDLPSTAPDAAVELGEILDAWSSTESLDNSADLQLVKDAHMGFLVGSPQVSDNSMTAIFNALAAKFTFEERDLHVCSVLIETHKLWKKIQQSNDLHLAYVRLSQSVSDKPLFKLILLTERLSELVEQKEPLTEQKWEELISSIEFSLLVKRELKRSYVSMNDTLKSIGVARRHAKLKLA